MSPQSPVLEGAAVLRGRPRWACRRARAGRLRLRERVVVEAVLLLLPRREEQQEGQEALALGLAGALSTTATSWCCCSSSSFFSSFFSFSSYPFRSRDAAPGLAGIAGQRGRAAVDVRLVCGNCKKKETKQISFSFARSAPLPRGRVFQREKNSSSDGRNSSKKPLTFPPFFFVFFSPAFFWEKKRTTKACGEWPPRRQSSPPRVRPCHALRSGAGPAGTPRRGRRQRGS